MQLISLFAILVTACFAFRVGRRWCDRCGVCELTSSFTISGMLAVSGVVAATQVVALAGLLTEVGLVSPAAIAIIFAVLTLATSEAVDRFLPATLLTEQPPQTPSASLGRWVWPIAIVTAVYALFLVDGVTRYPTGVDGLHYHLPEAVEWMRTGRMDLVVGLRLQSYWNNGMVIPALLLGAKLESLATIAMLPYALLVGASIYALARQLGASLSAALVSACVALSVPIVLFQGFSSYIDVFAAAAWLCSLLAVVWASRAPTTRARYGLIILAGIAAGVALGSKMTYLALALLLLAVVIRFEWVSLNRRPSRRPRPVIAATVFCVACIPCSAFWFVRGVIQADNPVYPFAIKVAGNEVFSGFYADDSPCYQRRSAVEKLERWWSYPWRETKYSGTGYPYGVNNALGAPYAMLVPLSILAVLIGFIRRKPRSWQDRWLVTIVVLALAGLAAHVTIFREMLRFALPCILVAIPVSALLIDKLSQTFPRALPTLVTLAFVTTGAVAGLKPAHAIAGRVKDHVWTRSAFYEIPALIDALPAKARILNLASPYATYPLLSEGLDLDVVSPHHWRIWTGGKTTASALYKYGIEYVYYRPIYSSNDWRDDLPLELLYDDQQEASPLPGPPRKLFRVIPRRKIANRSQRFEMPL